MRPNTPFIIWTLQRTGGTNLARHLFEKSDLLSAARRRGDHPGILAQIPDQWKLHEPFNFGPQGRMFGYLTERWIEHQERDTIAGDLADICAMHLPFKHCVEMVPFEVTAALAEAACNEGYAHLFLYRRKPLQRLLSLHFAKLSGVWGPEMRGHNKLSETIFAQPLPVAELTEHERLSTQKMRLLWSMIRKKGALPLNLAYEDIFQAQDTEQAFRMLKKVFELLCLSQSEADDRAFSAQLIGRGDQGTRDHYTAFRGVSELEAALEQVPGFIA